MSSKPRGTIEEKVKCGTLLCLNPAHLALKPVNDVPARFWPRVTKTETCWLWDGYIHPKKGYGYFSPTATTNRLAHRVAWEITHDVRLREDQILMHSCDNPRCVNPAHLSIGTHAENKADCVAKGRQARGPELSKAVRAAHERKRALVAASAGQQTGALPSGGKDGNGC